MRLSRFSARSLALALAFAGLMTGLITATALADTLVLRDGRRLEGELIKQDAAGITFAAKIDGKVVVQRYSQNKIKRIIPGKSKPTETKPKPVAKVQSDRVIVLMDLSGSMGLFGRLKTARAEALQAIKDLPGHKRVLVTGFAEGIQPIQKGSFRSAIASNFQFFENTLRRTTIQRGNRTDFLTAFKEVQRSGPGEIMVFTDGIVRTQTGSDAESVAKSLKKALGNIKISVTLIRNQLLPYFGGEPCVDSEAAWKALAKDTGGTFKTVGDAIERQKELGVKIRVLGPDGKEVKALKIGQRYSVHVDIKGLDSNNYCFEYVLGTPMTATSVTADNKALGRGQRVSLSYIKGQVKSKLALKIVSSSNNYGGQPGYLTGTPGGKVTFEFDALGKKVTLALPVE